MGTDLKTKSLFKIFVVTRVLLKDKSDKYLLLRRKTAETYGGTWEIPGGKLESLESISESTIREVFEEIGLVVNIEGKISHISTNIAKESKYIGNTFLNLIYEGKIVAGKIKLTDHDKYGWFTREEIADMNVSYYLKMPLIEILFPQ